MSVFKNSKNHETEEEEPPPPYEEVAGPQSAGAPASASAPQWEPSPSSPAAQGPSSSLLSPISPGQPWPPGQQPPQRPRSHSAHSPHPYPAPPSPHQLSPYPGQAAHQQARRAVSSTRPHSYSGPSEPPPPSIPRQFPQAFNVYIQSFSRTMFLGEHQTNPIYALRSHSGFVGGASLVLHSGPSEGYPPLATLDFDPFGRSMAVSLPPAAYPGAPATVPLEGAADFPHASYLFTIDVGNSGPRPRGGGWPLEQFEWRRSRGDAVANLGGRSQGWKLVRLAGGPPPGAATQGPRARYVAGGDRGSDGAEVVAVWAETGYSASKAMRFAFLGTGAGGLLGERWAIMSVMTALGMFERERRRSRR